MVLKEKSTQIFDAKRSRENLARLYKKFKIPVDGICDNCGHKNPIIVIFCTKCGEKLPILTPESLLSKACSVKNPNNFEESIKYLNKALKLNPSVHIKSLILFNKGLKLKRVNGKNSKANKCLKEFIKIAPLDLQSSKKIAIQLINGKDINKLYPEKNNRPFKNQGVGLRRFNLSIRETSLGTFGSNKKKLVKALVELTSEDLIIAKKSIITGGDRGNLTLRYLDIISIDEDRGWALSTVQIRMAGNHTVNLQGNNVIMRNFFRVLKYSVDLCKAQERTKESKKFQIHTESIKNDNISKDPVDKLVKLAKLLEDGLIDKEEFIILKSNIMKNK